MFKKSPMNHNKLSIVYMSPFPPVLGASGADRRVKDLAVSLSLNGQNVELIVPAWSNTFETNVNSKYFEIIYLGPSKRNGLITRIIFFIMLSYHVMKDRPNYIFFYMAPLDSIPFIFLFKLFNVKTILEMSDLNSVSYKGIMYWKYRLPELLVPKLTHLNIGISSVILEHYDRVNPRGKKLLLPILADTESFDLANINRCNVRNELDISKDEVVILYAGSFYKDEGVAGLIHVFNELLITGRKIRLYCIGRNVSNNVMYDDVELLIRERNIKNVFLTGFLTTTELKNYYSAADILVAPQLDNNFNKAAFPTKLAEYSCTGKCIILTDVGDISLYFQDGVNCLMARDMNSLLEKLKQGVDSFALRQKLGESAYNLARNNFDRKINGLKILQKLNSYL
jgi:glycosyltransferase involved in cell wall biosynthesis